MALDLATIQKQARCNYCRNTLDVAGPGVTESNFIDTGKTFGDGTKATALYCNECLANEYRTSNPKAAINRNTLDEIDVSTLTQVQSSDQDQQQQQQPTG